MSEAYTIKEIEENIEYLNYCNEQLEKTNKNLNYKVEKLEEDYRITCEQKNKYINTIEQGLNNAEQEIERLNNIIKEAIEYIQDRYDGEVLTHTFDKCNVGELLEILDKGE